MSKKKIILGLVFFIAMTGCKYSMETRIANEKYVTEVLSKYEKRYIKHFPNKIESEPVSFGGRIKNEHTEHSVFLITKYSQKTIDTLYQYFQFNSIQQYSADQKNLLIVNRFTTDDNWYENKIATDNEIKHFTQEVEYGDRLPIPNFWDRSYIIGDTECHLDPNFDLFILESKSGKHFADSLLTQGLYMPEKWKHGFTRGIGINKENRKVVYWFSYW